MLDVGILDQMVFFVDSTNTEIVKEIAFCLSNIAADSTVSVARLLASPIYQKLID